MCVNYISHANTALKHAAWGMFCGKGKKFDDEDRYVCMCAANKRNRAEVPHPRCHQRRTCVYFWSKRWSHSLHTHSTREKRTPATKHTCFWFEKTKNKLQQSTVKRQRSATPFFSPALLRLPRNALAAELAHTGTSRCSSDGQHLEGL